MFGCFVFALYLIYLPRCTTSKCYVFDPTPREGLVGVLYSVPLFQSHDHSANCLKTPLIMTIAPAKGYLGQWGLTGRRLPRKVWRVQFTCSLSTVLSESRHFETAAALMVTMTPVLDLSRWMPDWWVITMIQHFFRIVDQVVCCFIGQCKAVKQGKVVKTSKQLTLWCCLLWQRKIGMIETTLSMLTRSSWGDGSGWSSFSRWKANFLCFVCKATPLPLPEQTNFTSVRQEFKSPATEFGC